MSIGIGIIGAGIMGADHARIFARHIAGAHLVAISDADEARARAVAAETGAGRGTADPFSVIDDPAVQAVLVASPDATHPDFAIACIKAGKPVLCEKPLAPTAAEGMSVIEAELAAGRRLVQLGYMRRFDPGYTEMKALLEEGSYGEALAFHCIHRNAKAPPHFDAAAAIVSSCGHEVDIARFVLTAELATVCVHKAKRSRLATFDDPMLVVFETDKGQLVDVELFINAQYGYDVKGELVCESGTISFGPTHDTQVRSAGVTATRLAPDWRPRFAAAYRIQNQAWVNAMATGQTVGSSAWDGFVATTVTDAGVKSLNTGETVAIAYEKRPGLYG